MLRTELEKPKKEQIFSEDFFLEMENSLKTVSNNFPNTLKKIDNVRDVLISKYKNKVINNVTDFRKLTKIATASKNLNISSSKIEKSLENIFTKNNTNIESVYRNTVETQYSDRLINNSANNFLLKLENLSSTDLKDATLKSTLIKIKKVIDKLIKK